MVLRLQRTQINFRLDETEYQKLTTSARAYGLTPSKYAQKLALDSRLVRPRLLPEKQQAAVRQLQGIGNNLNQIAKTAHIDPESVTADELQQLRLAVQKTWQLLK
ncbi:mobilization protein [Ligilactobacillus acidipiscis]|uniref:Mobilization protein n=1 Tax=Ligilactobacillus acidipiscis TaxID=89059 RepID=A0A0R2K1E5_9LACO|nr:mobilization protein [Ligilactobacillus acidipiscis]